MRMVEKLALPAYIASLTASVPHSREVVPSLPTTPALLALAGSEFIAATGASSLPTLENAGSQRAWDDAACRLAADGLLATSDQLDAARLRAAGAPHSGAWLHAAPIASLGLLLDPECIRTAVALRLGAPVCEPHRCRCGRQVDRLGLHGLSCCYSAGRLPRHTHLNDVVKRGLAAAGVPSWLEPIGLDGGMGRGRTD